MAPALIQLSCQIESVTPGKDTITLHNESYGEITVAAKPAQIKQAVVLHNAETPVEARLFQLTRGYQLLSLHTTSKIRKKRTPEERPCHILKKWHGVLHRLAQ